MDISQGAEFFYTCINIQMTTFEFDVNEKYVLVGSPVWSFLTFYHLLYDFFILGFDPFIETQKGFAELMENEVVQQNINGIVGPKLQQQTQHPHQILDNMQRTRMPPPGFNHMNSLGFDSATKVHSSKIFPFINMPNSSVGNSTAQVELHPLATNWSSHLTTLHQPQGALINDSQLQHQIAQTSIQNKGNKLQC